VGRLKHNPDHLDCKTWQAIRQNSIEVRWKHILLIVLNPLLKILVEVINFFMGDIKVNATCEQLNEFYEIVVIVFIQEVAFEKHGARYNVQIEWVSAIIFAFSDATLGTQDPNVAGIVFPAQKVASLMASHTAFIIT
jgi:hypothetical protein